MLFGGRAIRRLRLPDLALDMRFPLFNDGAFFQGPMSTTASEILALPGRPESLIVARWGDHNHDPFESDGVAVYDNGIKRPDSTANEFSGSPAINTIQLSSSGTAIYGLTTSNSGFTFSSPSVPGMKLFSFRNLCYRRMQQVLQPAGVNGTAQSLALSIPFRFKTEKFGVQSTAVDQLLVRHSLLPNPTNGSW